ncbi:hypothetical protein WJX84_001141 [Apatococcus fuscideae]|uniref:ABC transporter domain-containing protein n=1 Tax=Apatococcus fuscideae TaxID=2026836 RepID=A0AAW1T9P9_9CHLO
MMVTPGIEGLGTTNVHGGKASYRRLSVGEFEHLRRKDDDEAELQTAALERPDYTSLDSSKVLLPSKDQDAKEPRTVSIRHMTRTQKEILVNNVLETEDQEALELFRKMKERRERVNLPLSTVEVRFEKLTIAAPISVGSSGLPTITNAYRGMFDGFLEMIRLKKTVKRDFTILDNVSGIIPPNRICLLLGPPGSGKSTLLEALAGKLEHNNMSREGDITYNGRSLKEFIPERTAAYVTQYDNHMAELTVRETLDFSRRVQGAGSRGDNLEALKEAEKAAGIEPDPHVAAFMKANTLEGKAESIHTEFILHILGLNVCADTLVGSQMIRGISGGQKKRVTTAEMISGPKRTLFMDEISTGLDSSTTFQIVRNFRDFAHLAGGTVLIALLQPAPEVFDLFDDVMLLSEGHVLYHGPRGEVLGFFQSLGFDCPARKGIPDFLQEVTGRKDQQAYWVRSEPYQFVSVLEIAEAFQTSKIGQENAARLAQPFQQDERSEAALVRKRYALSGMEELKACLRREWTSVKRTAFIYVFKTAQVIIMGLIAATLWLRTQLHPRELGDATRYAGFTFFTLITLIFNGIAEMSIAIEKLPIFVNQRDNFFYRPASYVMPVTLMRLPYSLLEAVVWTGLTYWEIDLAPDAGRFFIFLFLCFLVHQWSVSFFRMMGAICRNLVVANAVGLMMMLVILLCGGFVITKQNIHHWVVWLYWISPMQYAQRAFLINEFTSQRWQKLPYPSCGAISDTCSASTRAQTVYSDETLGNGALSQFGFPDHYKWVWIGIGYLVFCIVLFNLAIIWAHKALGAPGVTTPTKSEEQLQEREDALHGNKGTTKAGSSASNGASFKEVEMGSVDVATGNGKVAAEPASGMSLPFEPVTLTFNELHYLVPLPPQQADSPNAVDGPNGRELELLKGISGAFRPRTLTALMGVTGAGKTTLMDVLACRKTGGRITGDVMINGHPQKADSFARVSGYVEQTDIHEPFTTVKEALTFSANMRITNPPDSAATRMYVDEVMKLVELEPLAGSLAGRPGESGLSVEQRKRLTIAVELVANPAIVFMDEPTSGLDARAAAIVMRCVRNIVNTGRTIVCTIHQPSIDIFESFTELVLLKRGGETISVDPWGHIPAAPGVEPIKEGLNPATWMLEQTTVGQEARLGVNFAEIYRQSDFARDYQKIIEDSSTPKDGSQPIHFDKKFALSMVGQYRWLLWRYMITYWRTTEYNAVRFLLTIGIAVFFGFVFWTLGGHVTSQLGITAVQGALYASTVFVGIINSISCQPIVAGKRGVMYREKAAGMYSVFPWVAGMATAELVYGTVQAVIFSCVLYFAAGFARDAGKFFWFLLFCWFTLIWFSWFGMASVALTPNVKVAAVFSSNFYSLVNLFAGFILPRPDVPGWWVWMSWLCPTTYTIEGLIASQVGNYVNPLVTGSGTITTPRQYIKSVYGYRATFLGQCVAILASWLVALFFISYLCFRYINHLKR